MVSYCWKIVLLVTRNSIILNSAYARKPTVKLSMARILYDQEGDSEHNHPAKERKPVKPGAFPCFIYQNIKNDDGEYEKRHAR